MRPKGVTSVELAKLAGVSSATISRAFSADSSMRPETRERILALADQYGFRPNAMARSLNSSKSRLVAIVVNTVANPAEGEGLDQLVHRLQAMERMPLLLCCANHEDRSQLMRLASAYRVDHVVLQSDAVTIADALDIFRSAVLVVASAEPLAGRNLSDVRLDSSMAAAEIVDRLVADGRRRFCYLAGRAGSYVDKQRMEWFAAALRGHGLGFQQVAHGDYSYESGFKEAVLLLRQTGADAVICANDLMAIGAKDAAHLLNIAVPERLAIVGHDGVALATWDAHAITTIMPPRGAVSDIIARAIAQPDGAEVTQEVVPCEVRWGRTT